MQQQLQQIVDSLESAQARLRRLADTIPVDAWARRPAPDAWSAVECVEHLNLTSRAYIPLLRPAIAEARDLRAEAPREYKRDFLGAFLSAMIGPLRHVGKFRLMRVKTTDDFVPHVHRSSDEVVSEFLRLQADLVSLTRSAEGAAIDKVKIVSPFGGKMRYNAYSALVIIPRHEHRHIEQAENAAR
jgi:hypothetical protein